MASTVLPYIIVWTVCILPCGLPWPHDLHVFYHKVGVLEEPHSPIVRELMQTYCRYYYSHSPLHAHSTQQLTYSTVGTGLLGICIATGVSCVVPTNLNS